MAEETVKNINTDVAKAHEKDEKDISFAKKNQQIDLHIPATNDLPSEEILLKIKSASTHFNNSNNQRLFEEKKYQHIELSITTSATLATLAINDNNDNVLNNNNNNKSFKLNYIEYKLNTSKNEIIVNESNE
eukprot:312420_1